MSSPRYLRAVQEAGALHDAGLIDREQAIDTIRKAGADTNGDATWVGADRALDRWQTITEPRRG